MRDTCYELQAIYVFMMIPQCSPKMFMPHEKEALYEMVAKYFHKPPPHDSLQPGACIKNDQPLRGGPKG